MKKTILLFLIFTLLFSLSNLGIFSVKESVKADSYQWIAINNGLKNTHVYSLAIDPTNTNIIYAGTGDGVFKSTDGGAVWTPINNGLININSVYSLAIDPTNTNIIYAGTGNGVFKSTDGGTVWTQMKNGLENNDLGSMLELPDLTTFAIAIDPTNTNIIYAGICNRVFKSTNGANSWFPSTSNLMNTPPQCIAIDFLNSNNIYVGTWGAGIFASGILKSIDGGIGWQFVNDGLTDNFFKEPLDVFSIAIDYSSTNIIYAGTEQNGVFKSSNSGISWTQTDLTDAHSVRSLAIDPTNTNIIYAGTGDGVFKSTDGGAVWTPINNGLINNISSVYSLAIDPTNTQVIYAGTDKGVYKLSTVKSFTITSSSSSGGFISPSGDISVNFGANQTFTITPDTGYKILDVKVDGASVGTVGSYTFDNVTSNHTIEATFEVNAFTITSSSSSGGFISPSGDISVNFGANQTFTITPDTGYKILDVKVDGASVGTVGSYTFDNVTSNHTIEATFEKEKTEIVITLQSDNSYMTVNNVSQEIDPGRGTKPVIIPEWSRTVVPIRAIVEALGGTIGWDGTERKVTINFKETVIELWIDNPQAEVNGTEVYIDPNNHSVKPIIINDRTMLPLRFVAESLGCSVDWDPVTKTIKITYTSSQ